MCGIFCYIGKGNAVQIAVEGLKKLEYRGYDSAGIACIADGKIGFCKEIGKVAALEKELAKAPLKSHLAIAQTRWATHGKADRINAHPHLDEKETIALVHNGIIENFEELRSGLKLEGVTFLSQTDSEVIAHLIARHYNGDMCRALHKVATQLKGAFAFALIHRDYPQQIFAIAHEVPLVLGLGEGESFIASDSNALAQYSRNHLFLANGEIAAIKCDQYDLYDHSLQPISRKSQPFDFEQHDASLGYFEHYTLKEIHEQPLSLHRAMEGRLLEETGSAHFEEFDKAKLNLLEIERIVIMACGTSLHAGYASAYMIEDNVRIPVQVEISSEFRYKNPIVQPGTLAIVISQSGETADTIAGMREMRAKGAKILAICNVQGSTIAREADVVLFLRAGPEIGVCSTKAFTSQYVVLALFSLMMARMRHLSKQEGTLFMQALRNLPEQVQQILDKFGAIQKIAVKYAQYDNFFFIGRRYMFPASMEGALKLKEISYINANGYPAGEMKHGPIALIDQQCPTVALCADKVTFEKMMSNLMEVKARSGPIIAIGELGQQLDNIADEVFYQPKTIDELAPILSTIVTQQLAYYIAKERGTDIDHPRNLAKSVTVE